MTRNHRQTRTNCRRTRTNCRRTWADRRRTWADRRRTWADRQPTRGRTVRDASQTYPRTDRCVANRPFERGPAVATDGGRPSDDDEEAEDEEPNQRMRDVDKTPPDENRDVNRVFERGGTEESVESEERDGSRT